MSLMSWSMFGKLGALANLETRYGDVTCGTAIDFNTSAFTAVDAEAPMSFGPGGNTNDTQPSPETVISL